MYNFDRYTKNIFFANKFLNLYMKTMQGILFSVSFVRYSVAEESHGNITYCLWMKQTFWNIFCAIPDHNLSKFYSNPFSFFCVIELHAAKHVNFNVYNMFDLTPRDKHVVNIVFDTRFYPQFRPLRTFF